MKTTALLFLLSVLPLSANAASTSGTRSSSVATCRVERINLGYGANVSETLSKPLIFQQAPGGAVASVTFTSRYAPSYDIKFEIGASAHADSSKLTAMKKSNHEVVSQYVTKRTLMNFQTGSGAIYKVEPNVSFMTEDNRFLFDISCGETVY